MEGEWRGPEDRRGGVKPRRYTAGDRKAEKRKGDREDGIQNEVWMWGGKGIKEALGRICQGIWRGEGFPERWREGIIVPIAKKRGAREVGEHRGVTLMSSAYKIYAVVLANRLEREIEERGIVSESQAGFRKGRGVMDNIYIYLQLFLYFLFVFNFSFKSSN